MSTSGTIKHAYAMTGVNNAGIQISKDRWNADLVVTGGTNGWLMVRDSGQPNGWGWSTAMPGDGHDNVLVGVSAGAGLTTGTGHTLLGTNAGQGLTTQQNCTFVGFHAGQQNTASFNTFVGACGVTNTIGTRNTFIGYVAGNVNTSGNDNTFIGMNAGARNADTSGNTYVGSSAGVLTTGSNNTIVGCAAGLATSAGEQNTYVGRSAAYAETGNANAYFGYAAGGASTAGNRNTYLGDETAAWQISGDDNVFVGWSAGAGSTTGGSNVAIGAAAGLAPGVAWGIAIGDHATATASAAIAIGASATNATANTAVIGYSTLTALRVGGSGTRFDLGLLGPTGVSIYAMGGGNCGTFSASTTATADTTLLGNLDFGSSGNAGAEHRGFALQSVLVGSGATNLTADAVFYTTNAGTISEKLRLTAAGVLTFQGKTNAYPALKRNGAQLDVRLADDSAAGDLSANVVTATSGFSSPSSMSLLTGTAIPAGGTVGAGVKVSSTANFGVFFGSGAPTLAAAKGSLYLCADGSSTSTRLYVNTNGTTGWTAVTTAT